jgi:hypothetical protein
MPTRRPLWLEFVAGVLALSAAIASPAPAATRSRAPSELTAQRPDDPGLPLGRQDAQIVFVTGFVDAIDKDFFGRPKKVAIVSISESGALLQNAVENISAGQELKHHVGEDVTARGVVLVKTDGSMALLVDAFQVHGEKGKFVGGSQRDSQEGY